MVRAELERLDREALIARAEALGVLRVRVLTRPELIDEILIASERHDSSALGIARGFFGLARDLLRRVIERGLHLPDAAELLRAVPPPPEASHPPAEPIPTVTLAEMYRAQGHRDRALATLEHVLAREPDHAVAAQLLAKWRTETSPMGASAGATDPRARAESAANADIEGRAAGGAEAAPEPPQPPQRPTSEIEKKRNETGAGEGAIAPACLALRLPAGELAVKWRVPRAGAGMLALRTLLIRWDGTRCHVDAVDREGVGPTGDLRIPGVPRDVAIRVAIGTLDGGTFRPMAQAPVLELVHEGDLVGVAPGGPSGVQLLGRQDGAWTVPDRAGGWGAALAFAESVLADGR